MWKTFGMLLAALGLGSGCSGSQAKLLELEGGIYLKGSVPHTYLVIEDRHTHRMYKIDNPASFDLIHRQKHVVKVQAKLLDEEKGPGDPATIEVVKVEGE